MGRFFLCLFVIIKKRLYLCINKSVMPAKSITQERNEAIRKAYTQWTDKKYKDVRIYTDEYIFQKLSEKFFLAPSTIERILYSVTN